MELDTFSSSHLWRLGRRQLVTFRWCESILPGNPFEILLAFLMDYHRQQSETWQIFRQQDFCRVILLESRLNLANVRWRKLWCKCLRPWTSQWLSCHFRAGHCWCGSQCALIGGWLTFLPCKPQRSLVKRTQTSVKEVRHDCVEIFQWSGTQGKMLCGPSIIHQLIHLLRENLCCNQDVRKAHGWQADYAQKPWKHKVDIIPNVVNA